MGAGKTTIGRLVAKQLGREFYDSDVEVERKTGVKIPLIFELEGEAGFRKRETQALEELTKMHHIVMATGGGAVLLPENRDMLKKSGTIIYLRGKVHDLYLRTYHDRSRPLLQGDNPKQKLERLYRERDPIYTAMANLIVDTGVQSANEITATIMQLISTPSINPTE